MTPEIERLRERRDRLAAELAELEARDQSQGVKTRIRDTDRALARADSELADAERAAERRLERVRTLSADPAHCEGPPPATERRRTMSSTNTIPNGPQGAIDAALRSVDEHLGETLTAPAGDRLDAVVRRDATGVTAQYVEAVSDPAYRSAFLKRLANPDPGPGQLLTPDEGVAMEKVAAAQQVRAMGVGEGATGGFAVPAQIDPTILLSSSGSRSPLRELARTVTAISNVWKGVSSEGVEASFDAEATQVGDDSPELAQPEIPLEKAQAFVPYSIEVGQDWSSLGEELARLFADAKDRIEATKFLLGEGSGSNEPEGLVSKLAEASIVETEGEKEVVASDIYTLQEKLGSRFQDGASWLSALATANQIHRFYSPAGEEPPLFNEDRSKLLGKPWAEASPMSSKTTTQEEVVLLYGDLMQAYTIADRIGLTVETIPHLFGANQRPTGQRGAYCYWRVGGSPVVPNAVRALEVK